MAQYETGQLDTSDSLTERLAMITIAPHNCATCNGPATLFCPSCAEDTSSETSCHTATWYCGKACQASDWPSHRSYCRHIVNLNLLQRIANLVQTVYFQMRAYSFEQESLESVESSEDSALDHICRTKNGHDTKDFAWINFSESSR